MNNMKAYLCTIGETTTKICKWRLEQLGFEVMVLDEIETWYEKYMRFLTMAHQDGQDCIRIDADIILNDKILLDLAEIKEETIMAQFSFFDFYRNEVGSGNPVYYSKEVLKIIVDDITKIGTLRPETDAWRLKQVNDFTQTFGRIVGMHGFFQDKETIERARQNKISRDQISEYDFELVDKIMNTLQ